MANANVTCSYCGCSRCAAGNPDRCDVCFLPLTMPAPTPTTTSRTNGRGRKVRPDSKARQQTVASRAATLLLSGRAVTSRYAIVYVGMVPNTKLYPVRARGEQTPHYRLATRCLPPVGFDGLIIN